ncbi:MAG TPA: alpha/beta hydrolase [Myxococcales bacterium]|nr:alpha/beta hydrolase [Myxococcales bacterium]
MSLRQTVSLGASALAAAAILVGFAYHRDISAARLRTSTGSAIAQTPCGPVEYAVRGDGPPVLVVHGAGGGFDQGLMLGEALPGFRVVAPSRFGYLRAPLPADGSAEAQADGYACLLDALHIPRAAVVGVSAGGPSAMQFCLRHADRCASMVLLVPLAWSDAPGTPERPMTRTERFLLDNTLRSDFVLWSMNRLFRGAMIESILGTPLADVRGASAAEQRRAVELLDSILPISRREAGLRNDAAVGQSLRRYPLERIAAPTLVASVEDDRYRTYGPARYTAAHIPAARFVGYARGGHLWLGHAEELSEAVRSFIRDESIPAGVQ